MLLWLWILVRPSTSATLCVFCRGGRGTVHWTITICMTGMRGKTGESFCLFVNKKSWISQNSKVFLVTLVYHINCFLCIKDIFNMFPFQFLDFQRKIINVIIHVFCRNKFLCSLIKARNGINLLKCHVTNVLHLPLKASKEL